MAEEKNEIVEVQADIMPIDGAIDVQVATAHKFPRSIARFQQMVVELATVDRETAEECWYSLPRAGKLIQGPSIRFAEIAATSYGNMHVGARPLNEGDEFVTCEGAAWDLENNVRAIESQKRRITDRNGKRFNADMVQTTIGACKSIALRNAVLRVIPRALVKATLDKVKRIAMGEGRTITETRAAVVAAFRPLGVSEQQLLDLLGKKGLDDVTLEDCTDLRGVYNAIKDKQTTVEDAFGAGQGKPSKATISKAQVKPAGKGKKHTSPAAKQEKPKGPSVEDARAKLLDAIDAALNSGRDLEEVHDEVKNSGVESTENCTDIDALVKAEKAIRKLAD